MKADLIPCHGCGKPVKMRYRKPMCYICCDYCGYTDTEVDIYEECDGRYRLAERWNRRADNE